jgi:hypothetical protein
MACFSLICNFALMQMICQSNELSTQKEEAAIVKQQILYMGYHRGIGLLTGNEKNESINAALSYNKSIDSCTSNTSLAWGTFCCLSCVAHDCNY